MEKRVDLQILPFFMENAILAAWMFPAASWTRMMAVTINRWSRIL